MTNDLTYEAVAELSRRTKRDMVAKWRPGVPDEAIDLVTHAVVVRDGRNVALVFASPNGPLAPRRAGYIAASLFRPDQLYMVADTVGTRGTVDQAAADATAGGEMLERWRAGDRKGLGESLQLHRYDRTGMLDAVDYPYTRVGALVTWGTPEVKAGADMAGEIAKHIAAGWAEGDKLWARVDTVLDDLLAEDPLLQFADVAAAKQGSAMDSGMVVLLDSGLTFVDGQPAR